MILKKAVRELVESSPKSQGKAVPRNTFACTFVDVL